MTTLLRAASSAEFLGIVPTLAGFTPRHSIVLLPFRGKRTHGAMRIDIPEETVDVDAFAESAIRLVSQVDATDALAIVVYSDGSALHTRDGFVLPITVVVDELLAHALDSGLRVVDALCVTPDGWLSYLVDEPVLHPLKSIPAAPVIPGVADISGDQMTGAGLPHADLAEKERVGRALADLTVALENDRAGRLTGTENPEALAAVVMLDDIPQFYESLLEQPENLPAYAAAALIWCLERPIFRDVALTQWATDLSGGNATLEAQLHYSRTGDFARPELAEMLLGCGPRPDPDRLRLALAVARHVAARAPRASQPGPLVAAAWLSWALGRSSHAAYYLEQTAAIDPEYGMAAIVRALLDAAVLPEWAFQCGDAEQHV